MPLPDLTKLILYSPDNAYKNVNKYSGSITFPTSLTSGQTATVTSTVILTASPVYTRFFSNFVELNDAVAASVTKQWYSANVSGNFGIGIHISTAPFTSWVGCGLYPVINGNVVTVTGVVINPTGSTVSLDALIVPFIFLEYTLAN